MGLLPGTKLDFIPNRDGTWRIVKRKRSIMELSGFFKWDGGPVTIEEIDKSVAERATDMFD